MDVSNSYLNHNPYLSIIGLVKSLDKLPSGFKINRCVDDALFTIPLMEKAVLEYEVLLKRLHKGYLDTFNSLLDLISVIELIKDDNYVDESYLNYLLTNG